MSLTALDFDVDHFINRGTFQITTGNVTGRVGALENAAIFYCLQDGLMLRAQPS